MTKCKKMIEKAVDDIVESNEEFMSDIPCTYAFSMGFWDDEDSRFKGPFKGGTEEEFTRAMQNSIICASSDGGWEEYLVPMSMFKTEYVEDFEFERLKSPEVTTDRKNGTHVLIMDGTYTRFTPGAGFIQNFAFGGAFGEEDENELD